MFHLPYVSMKEKVSPQEWQLRTELAACYRIAAFYGWEDSIYGHISAKIPDTDHYLINAYGLLFDEVSASNLVKVDLTGEPVESTPFITNPAGFVIHSAIHEIRPDARCVIHLHTNETVAIASLDQGLEPLCQHAMFPLSHIAYHAYEGLAVYDDEKKRLQTDLGQAHTLMLPNHGALTIGDTIGNCLMRWIDLQRACEIQLLLQATGRQSIPIDPQIIANVKAQQLKVHYGNTGGNMAWPAMMRRAYRLDPSFMD